MTGLILPVTLDGDRIKLTQNYGDDFAWKGYSQYYRQYYGLDGHNGIDVGGWGIDGERVNAAGDGTVVYAGTGDYWDSTVGGGSFTVVIHHPHLGIWTAYLHLRNNSNTVSAGQSVKQGQMIARAGNTGIGTGAHLHFQVMPVAPLPLVYQPNWGCVNPRPYMQRVTAQAGTTITPIKTGFEELMEQIMNWYDSKDDFEARMAYLPNSYVGKNDTEDVFSKINKIPNRTVSLLLNYDNTSRSDRSLYALFIDAGLNSFQANMGVAALKQGQASLEGQIAGLIGAIKAVSGGEKFDEAKLIEGVAKAAEAAAERGVSNAIGSIDANVTVNLAPNEKTELETTQENE